MCLHFTSIPLKGYNLDKSLYYGFIMPAKLSTLSIQRPDSNKIFDLTSAQLEHWFADMERMHDSNKNPDAYLAQQFLTRFGLKNAKNVIDFLKTHAGKSVLIMISRELMKIEALNEYLVQQYQEEALMRQKRLVLVLIAYIATQEASAEQVAENIHNQLDKKLKENKNLEPTKQKNPYEVILEVFDATIDSYSQTIKALDETLEEMEHELLSIEGILQAIENETLNTVHRHTHLDDHISQLATYLQLPLLNILKQPAVDPEQYRNQQIVYLTSQLKVLKAQHMNMNISTPNEQRTHENIGRKIRMVEEQLAFHHAQAQQPAQNAEEILHQLIEKLREQLSEQRRLQKDHPQPMHVYHEIEGLKLQKRGLRHAMQCAKKEKILLNAHLEQVHDFEQACFIIDPNHRARYKKQGDSYAILPEHANPARLNEQDWIQAKLNFIQLKPKIQLVQIYHQEKKQQELADHQQHKRYYQDHRAIIKEQIADLQQCKKGLQNELDMVQNQRDLFKKNPALTPLSFKPTPERTQQSSYSFMLRALERLVPTQAPAPRKEDINRVGHVLQTAVAPDNQFELKKLISEVKPGEIMASDLRLSWLNRAKRLIPNLPISEVEADPSLKKR